MTRFAPIINIIIFFFVAIPIMSQTANRADQNRSSTKSSLKANIAKSDSIVATTIDQAQLWQTKKELELADWGERNGYTYNLYAIESSISIECDTIAPKQKIKIGAEYNLPLNTTNFTFGLTLWNYKKADIYAYGIIGAGSQKNSVIQYLDPMTGILQDTRIESNIGAGLEAGFQWTKTIYPLVGVNLCSVRPNNGSSGRNLNGYVGFRAFSPWQSKYYRLAADIKAGSSFWSGFSHIGSGSSTYIGAGLSLISAKPFGWAREPKFAPLETSLLYIPTVQTISAKMTLPYRIFEQLSVGASAYLGTDIRTFSSAQREATTFMAVGLDLRLYGDTLSPLLNPFVNIYWGWLEYDAANGLGHGNVLNFGNRFKVTNYLYFDVFTGPTFWKTPWLKDRTTGTTLPEPPIWDVGFGLTYKLPWQKNAFIDNQLEIKTSYAALKDIKAISDQLPQKGTNSPLLRSAIAEVHEKLLNQAQNIDGKLESYINIKEKRYYSIQPVKNADWGDVTDIKFFKISLGLSLGINKNHEIPYNNQPNMAAGDTLLIAVFDKAKVRVEKIKETNLFLHISDMINGRYFGYRWDQNRRMQPEYRTALNVRPLDQGNKIYGSYDQFVKPMEWLKGSEKASFMHPFTIEKEVLAQTILRSMNAYHNSPDDTDYSSTPTRGPAIEYLLEHYDIAYATYPSEEFNLIEQAGVQDYGVSIMFRFDNNNNFHNDDALSGHFLTNTQIHSFGDTIIESMANDSPTFKYISTDFEDGAFFSNTVHGKYIIGDTPTKPCILELNEFKMGEHQLTVDHREQIRNWISQRDCNNRKIEITGYVDGTPYDQHNYERQKDLAERRAQSVKQYITQLLGDNIEIEGIVEDNAPEYDGKRRRVIIKTK